MLQALIDWVTITVFGVDDPLAVIRDVLRMDPNLFLSSGGVRGYAKGYEYNNIRVSYDSYLQEQRDMGICVSMSGKGCRVFETISGYSDMAAFIQFLHENSLTINVTRLDLAIDDHENILDMEQICDAVDKHMYRSRMNRSSIIKSWKQRNDYDGMTAYIGSRSSDFFIRFYDKTLEQQLTDGSDWVRCEMVFRKDQAHALVGVIVNSECIGDVAAAILNDKLAFVELDDSNISRCSISEWWLQFIDSIQRIHIISRGPQVHTINEKFDWLRWQVAPSLVVIKKTLGFAELLRMLDEAEERLSPKQRAEIKSYEQVCNAGY